MANLENEVEILFGDQGNDPVNDQEVEVEETEVEVEAEDPEAETEEESESEQVPDIENLSDLAQAIEWDVADLYKVKIPVANGDPISLGELKDQYQEFKQTSTKYQQAMGELEEQRTKAESEYQNIVGMPLDVVQAQLQIAQLQEQFQKTDWQKLREENPQRYAILRQDFQDAFASANGALNQKLSAFEQSRSARQQAVMETETKKTIEKIPEWQDPKVREKEIPQMLDVLIKEYGFSQEELGTISDHRFLLVARDLLKMKGQVKSGAEAIKRVSTAPKKPLRPGKVHSSSELKASKLKRLETKVKQKGASRQDQDEFAAELLFG